MAKISVIIPLYNKGPYIARTLNSVLNQTFQDYEVIIVDDGSTDNGAEIVKSYKDPRIRLVIQKNQGVSAARNRGVQETITEFITFLDADDEWMPSHLTKINELKNLYPHAGIYVTSWKSRTPDGNMKWADYKCIPNPPWDGIIPNYFKSSALGVTPISASVAGIPKKIFLEMGGFPEGFWFGEDHDLWGRIALKYPIAFSWELGSIYHLEAINRARNNVPPLYDEEPFVRSARNALRQGGVLPEYVESINEYICRKEIERAAKNIQTGNNKNAIKILNQCNTRWFYKDKLILYILALMPNSIFQFMRKIKKMFKN